MVNNCINIILLTIFVIAYHTNVVISGHAKEVLACIYYIYNDFEYDKSDTYKLKQDIAFHAMKRKREDLLVTNIAREYFYYLRDYIFVDDRLPSPDAFCEQLAEGIDVMEDLHYYNMIQNEVQLCKETLYDFFLQSNDVIAVAKTAFETLLESYFTSMMDTNYAKQYYFILAKYTYFNINMKPPIQYCREKRMKVKNATNLVDINKKNKRKKLSKTDQGIVIDPSILNE